MASSRTDMRYTAMVLGATGNVGGCIARLLIESPRCRRVVVIVRRKAQGFSDPKVTELVVDMDRLEEDVGSRVEGIDVALAAFGVGKGTARMSETELRRIEVTYPLAFCRAAKAAGARVGGVMTAVGADSESRMKYAKIIGEKQKAVESVAFDFLGIYRPAVILGNSNTPGILETLMPWVHWAMPSRYHSIHKGDIARAMVAQSERALLEIRQGSAAAAPRVQILEYKDMKPLFLEEPAP